jgi:hypothetical protein
VPASTATRILFVWVSKLTVTKIFRGRAIRESLRITTGASLFTSRTAYSAGQYPAFQIDAVSTASRTCSFDISPHRLHVQVMSKGRVIWDSADCSRGEPNRSIQFRRGGPAETAVTWRRIVSLPGCVTVASSARPGSYQVQAKDSSVASPVRSFKLVR